MEYNTVNKIIKKLYVKNEHLSKEINKKVTEKYVEDAHSYVTI